MPGLCLSGLLKIESVNSFKCFVMQKDKKVLFRLIRQLHLTGTYKLQKTELQKEGFDVNNINDPVFFMGPKVETMMLKIAKLFLLS